MKAGVKYTICTVLNVKAGVKYTISTTVVNNYTPHDDQDHSPGGLSHASPSSPNQTSFGTHPESKPLNYYQ